MYMHNHDKYPAPPGFESGTSRLQAPCCRYEWAIGAGVAVSAYPLSAYRGGTLKLVSAYRGYVETSFNVPPGKLKLEKGQFQVTP